MRRSKFRTLFAALGAVMALGALASASASAALPEIVPTPSKTNPIKFSGRTGSVVFESSTQESFLCTKASLWGEFISPQEVVARMEYTGCASRLTEEIGLTEGLKGHLGYVAKEAQGNESGLGLRGTGTEEMFAKHFGLPTRHEHLYGGAIGMITPLNASTSKLTLIYKQSNGVQGYSFPCRHKATECVVKHEFGESFGLKDSFEHSVGFQEEITIEGFEQGGKSVKVEVKA